jgi:hypothetical protein
MPRELAISVPILVTGFPELRRIDLVLTGRQARAMRLAFDGLQAQGEQVRLIGPRDMRMPGDALRWILDEIADEAGIPA